jgi:hypothetical protein
MIIPDTYDEDGNYSMVPSLPRDERVIAAGVMELHWQPHHLYSAPNQQVYPWMWLWDSCFHSLVWHSLGDKRAHQELHSIFDWQTEAGFVPHMGYQADPEAARSMWGRRGASVITQPPMYGHALRQLALDGYHDAALEQKAAAGLRWLFRHRMAPNGLIRVLHPWETGCDDSPRWASWQPSPFDRASWGAIKRDMVSTLVIEDGASVANPRFDVCSASFNALVAFNTMETGMALEDPALVEMALGLAAAIDEQMWDGQKCTWVDLLPSGHVCSSADTLDSLLGVLITPDQDKRRLVLDRVLDDQVFGGSFGPAGVSRHEDTFDAAGYWRGAAWPQLTYLLWVAATESGMREHADRLSSLLRGGADHSGYAEYWDPDTGRGLGAIPQSWSLLATIPMARLRRQLHGGAGNVT